MIEVLHSAIDALERQELPHGLSEDVGLPGSIQRAETHDIDLGQPVGHEPGFTRPVIVASVDMLNNGPGGLVVVVSVDITAYGLRRQIESEPEASGARTAPPTRAVISFA